MSSATLLLSGSLVASGLVLGAFTLHGAFDPPHKQVRAAARQVSDPKGVTAFQTTTRSVAGDVPQTQKASTKPDARPADTADTGDGQVAAAKAATRRRLAEKKRAEKAEKEKAAKAKQEAAQQATLQWPWNWNLFGK